MRVPTWSAALRTGVGRAAVLTIAIVIVAMLVVAAQGASGQRLVTVAMINVVIVVGIGIFTGNSGVISFGHIGFAGMGAYTVAILSATLASKARRIPNAPFSLATVQLHPGVAVLVALALVAVFAAGLGLAIRRLSGTSATMITLAVLVVTYQVLNDWVSMTGGAEAFYGIPRVVTTWTAAAVMFVALAVAGAFKESPIGLQLRAAREDELAAASMGTDVRRARFAGWVLSAVVSAAGGALLGLYLGSITPTDFYLSLTLTTMAMVFVGGVRGVTGIVVGVVMVTVGREVFRYLGDGPTIGGLDLPAIPGLTDIFLGLVITLTMILRPKGLLDDWEIDRLLPKRWRRLRQSSLETSASRQAAPAPGRRPDANSADRAPAVLRAVGAGKRFEGIVAVDSVDLELRAGSIVGLIGPNGSGKTTMLNMLSGVLEPTAGRLTLSGKPIPVGAHFAALDGIARTFQNIRLFADLTVADNIAVAGIAARQAGRSADVPMTDLIGRLGLADVLDRKAGTLPYGAQRRLEIARAAALAPDFIFLDEPVAGMNEVESAELGDVVRDLPSLVGCGVLVVDHDLPFILGLCERIVVMDSGRRIAEGDPETIRADQAVISAYLGAS
ncbi:MAG: hypothetical protein BGO26_02775 [Actinobacteria bacterium 69-20]|nr:ATP-binding cassette domain-containing protein [Actinomycetota bacterium]OJV30921.1 MAG: hypothetical protein BGO26_02775 [Actinobacteria bacterium 69-20]